MLIEFRVINYKSFKEELIFSLIPEEKEKRLKKSILKERIENKSYRSLCSGVIYGLNASGKTNLISAMDTFKSILLRGNINNSDKDSNLNIAARILELIPNNTLTEPSPVNFYIKFIEDKFLIEYTLSLDLGAFFLLKYKRKILKESLKINNTPIFHREDELQIINLDTINSFLVNNFKENKHISMARNRLKDEELFLTNDFKNLFSTKIYLLIFKWLEEKFMVIYNSDAIETSSRKFINKENKTIYVEKVINEIANLLETNSSGLGYVTQKANSGAKLYSILKAKKTGEGKAILAELFESYGVFRFLNIFPLIVSAISNGGILILDKFDAFIHPMLLLKIVNIFHDKNINKFNAQIIFTTHNPLFIDNVFFRDDEIKIIEKNNNSYCSVLYSLFELKKYKKDILKNQNDIYKYFIKNHSKIKEINFINIFENLLKDLEPN